MSVGVKALTEGDNRFVRRLLVLVAVILTIHFLRFAESVLAPFAAALFLSFLAYPFEAALIRRKIPEPIALAIIIVIALALIGGIGFLVRESLASFNENLPEYERRVTKLWRGMMPHLGFIGRQLREGTEGDELAKSVATIAASTVGSMFVFAEELALVLFYLIFLLLGRRRLGDRFVRAFGPERAERAMATLGEIERKTFRYVGLRTILCAITAAVVWIILFIYDVDFTPLWTAATFVGQYVPIAGPVAASVAPISVALLQNPSPEPAMWVALWLTLWHLFVGYFLEPRLFGKGMELNQLVLLFGMVFFAWLWGVVGAILAVPLLMMAKIICEHVPPLRSVSVLIGGDGHSREIA